MSKMGSHDPFGHLQHKLWQKETLGVKIDNLTPDHKKLGINRTFMRAGGMQHVIGRFRRKLQLCFRPHLNRRSEYEIIAHKVAGVLTLAISGLPFGSPGTKSHLDVGLAERCRVYYMGESGGFPRVWAVVSLVSSKSPVAYPSTKGAPTLY
jgi:hypothetical protein